MKYKVTILFFLVLSISLFSGCTFLQDLKQVAENNIDWVNQNIQATNYYPYVEFGENIDMQTGALYSQSVNNEFKKSTLNDIYARMAILATNQSSFSLVYKIKLGRTEIDSGTITGNLTPGTTTHYVAIVVPITKYGYGTYTVDFFESTDTLKAIAS